MTVSQTNWEYHTKTFSVPIKLTERKWNITFDNHVALEAKLCNFNCESPQCTAEETALRDQIIIGSKDNEIRQEALKRSWLESLRKEGVKKVPLMV